MSKSEHGIPSMTPSSDRVSRQMAQHPRQRTGPEMALRRRLFAEGYRYRVQYRVPQLPRRTIDIAFPRQRLAVFVDGCFWHGCRDHRSVPAANRAWWAVKLEGNRRRDDDTNSKLRAAGWQVLRIWEHEPSVEAVQRIVAALDWRAQPVPNSG